MAVSREGTLIGPSSAGVRFTAACLGLFLEVCVEA